MSTIRTFEGIFCSPRYCYSCLTPFSYLTELLLPTVNPENMTILGSDTEIFESSTVSSTMTLSNHFLHSAHRFLSTSFEAAII